MRLQMYVKKRYNAIKNDFFYREMQFLCESPVNLSIGEVNRCR